MNASAHCRC